MRASDKCRQNRIWLTHLQVYPSVVPLCGTKEGLSCYNALMLNPALFTNRVAFQGLISLVFGLLVLMFPKLLNYLIAFYFILTGLSAILPYLR